MTDEAPERIHLLLAVQIFLISAHNNRCPEVLSHCTSPVFCPDKFPQWGATDFETSHDVVQSSGCTLTSHNQTCCAVCKQSAILQVAPCEDTSYEDANIMMWNGWSISSGRFVKMNTKVTLCTVAVAAVQVGNKKGSTVQATSPTNHSPNTPVQAPSEVRARTRLVLLSAR